VGGGAVVRVYAVLEDRTFCQSLR